MFSSPSGELRNTYLIAFVLILIAFFVIGPQRWLLAGSYPANHKRWTNFNRATQYVQAGDLSTSGAHRRRDQLGVLGESFKSMTGSISGLIEEQKQRQRLENEISIAREGARPAFPQSLAEGCPASK